MPLPRYAGAQWPKNWRWHRDSWWRFSANLREEPWNMLLNQCGGNPQGCRPGAWLSRWLPSVAWHQSRSSLRPPRPLRPPENCRSKQSAGPHAITCNKKTLKRKVYFPVLCLFILCRWKAWSLELLRALDGDRERSTRRSGNTSRKGSRRRGWYRQDWTWTRHRADRTELHQGQHEKEHRVWSVLPAVKFL